MEGIYIYIYIYLMGHWFGRYYIKKIYKMNVIFEKNPFYLFFLQL